jgi:hypothetical protein
MAAQMVEYSKNNILMQAGRSMLAQANQSTQGAFLFVTIFRFLFYFSVCFFPKMVYDKV